MRHRLLAATCTRASFTARASLAIGFCRVAILSVRPLAIGLVAGYVRAGSMRSRCAHGRPRWPSPAIPHPPSQLVLAVVGRRALPSTIAIVVPEIPRVVPHALGGVVDREEPMWRPPIAAGATPRLLVRHVPLQHGPRRSSSRRPYIAASAILIEAILCSRRGHSAPRRPRGQHHGAEGRTLRVPAHDPHPGLFLAPHGAPRSTSWRETPCAMF